MNDGMSDEPRRWSQSILFWFFCLLAAPVVVIAIVFAAVFIENTTWGSHHIESRLNDWGIDGLFIGIARLAGLRP
jgi:hypothetical protein